MVCWLSIFLLSNLAFCNYVILVYNLSFIYTKHLLFNLLYWLFYNFKSSKFNRLANLFKKVFSPYFFNVNSVVKMAINSYFQYSHYWNLLLINSIDNKFANCPLRTPIKNNSSLVLIFLVFFYNPTSNPTLVITLTSAFAL